MRGLHISIPSIYLKLKEKLGNVMLHRQGCEFFDQCESEGMESAGYRPWVDLSSSCGSQESDLEFLQQARRELVRLRMEGASWEEIEAAYANFRVARALTGNSGIKGVSEPSFDFMDREGSQP